MPHLSLRLTALGSAFLLALTAPGPAHAQPARAPRSPATPSPATPRPAPEPFADFFQRFRQDSTFQLARTRFPLPWYSLADDATRQLPARDWTFVSFYSGQETYVRLFDNFAMREADTNERVYALIGVASDIRQNFFFRRLGGRWFLVRVEDWSY